MEKDVFVAKLEFFKSEIASLFDLEEIKSSTLLFGALVMLYGALVMAVKAFELDSFDVRIFNLDNHE